MWIAKNNDLIVMAKDTQEELMRALVCNDYTSIEETDIDYQLYNGEYLTPDEITIKERERLDSLYMTRSDFFDGFILAFGLGQIELRIIVENILNSINITPIEIKIALNNYDNALNFYRKHTLFTLLNNVPIPISDTIVLVFTNDIWDSFFSTKDYRILQQAIQPIPESDTEE